MRKQETCFFDHRNFIKIYEHYATKMDYEKAEKVVRVALEQYPFSSYFFVKKAQLRLIAKDYLGAIRALDKAKLLDAAEPEIYFIESRIYAEQGKYAEAGKVLENLLDFIDSDLVFEVYLELADLYHRKGEWKQELESIKMALILEPESEEGLDRIMEITDAHSLYHDAADFHQKLLDDAPLTAIAWLNLGICLYHLEDYSGSVESLEYAIALNDELPEAYFECGESCYELKEYEKARENYLEALRLTGGDEDIYFSLGMCHYHLADYKKAAYYFKRTLLMDDSHDEAHYQQGRLLLRKEGITEDALMEFQAAVINSEFDAGYLRNFVSLLVYDKQYARAIEVLDEAIKNNSTEPFFWMLKSACLLEKGDPKASLQVLEEGQAIAAEKTTHLYYTLYSAIAFENGLKSLSEEWLDRALLLNEDTEAIFAEWFKKFKEPELLSELSE